MKIRIIISIYILSLQFFTTVFPDVNYHERIERTASVVSQDHFFKEYDLRGRVGKDFEIKNVYGIARAIAAFFVQKNQQVKNIAVGMDGRLHSQAIKEQLCKAFIDSGLNVIFIGLCTTPVMYFATHMLDVDAGIMITASHNPKEDNGIKMVIGKESVWGNQIRTIRDMYNAGTSINANRVGVYSEHLLCTEYVHYLADKFKHLQGADIACAIDCGNGAAGSVMPMLVKKMDWKNVMLMNAEVDGNFPNHDPDPTVAKNLHVLKNDLAKNKDLLFGMALDGDCDRLAVMTKSGYLIPGDQLVGLFSQSLAKSSSKDVVVDIMCSDAVVQQFKALGFTPHFARTGIAFVKEAMKKHNALLGGEISGHVCFKDRYLGYDDGIYAIMRMIDMLHTSHKTLDDFVALFPQKSITTTLSIHCDADKKFSIVEQAKKLFMGRSDVSIIDIDGVRLNTSYGCGILRPSNTEPIIRLRVEAQTEQGIAQLKAEFFAALAPHFDAAWLKAQLSM